MKKEKKVKKVWLTLDESFDQLVASKPSWILHDPELPVFLQEVRPEEKGYLHPGRCSAPHKLGDMPETTMDQFKAANPDFFDGLPKEQHDKAFQTLIILGHVQPPAKIMADVDVTPGVTLEEQEQHDQLMQLMGACFEKGMSVNDTYEAALVGGLLEKRNGEPFSVSTFHKWARVVKMRVAHVKNVGRFRMTNSAKKRIEELVKEKYNTKSIYEILGKEGHLERPSGGAPFGFIAIRDRVGRAKRMLGLYCTSGARVRALHDMGRTEAEICKELHIDHKQYYSHAVRQGIITPKKKQEKK